MSKKMNVLAAYLLEDEDTLKRVIDLTAGINQVCNDVKTLDVLCASAFLFTAALNQLSEDSAYRVGDEKSFIEALPDMVDKLYKFIKVSDLGKAMEALS